MSDYSSEELQSEEIEHLRPHAWSDYVGQDAIKNNLEVFIKAAKRRGECIDHTLFFGPPGLGKTTLSYIIARQMGANIKTTSAPMIEKRGDLAAIISNLEANDILFIDEIHRLNPAIEEILYSAMEDFRLDIIIGSGVGAQTIKIDLPPFTLIGATTRAGMLSNPLRDRFGINFRLQFYSFEELATIVRKAALKIKKPISDEAALEISRRSRGTPRIALRLLKRVRDYSDVAGEEEIDSKRAKIALDSLGVDEKGFDELDIAYLRILCEGDGRAIGLATLAAALSEDASTIEDMIEPYLLANGYLEKTAKGRIPTNKAFSTLNLGL